MSKEELIIVATKVCCPMCDLDKCVGRFDCEEIKMWCDSRKDVM